jgi:hypothetical protein
MLLGMANRIVRAWPSTTDDLRPWQTTLTEKLSQLHKACFAPRKSLTRTIQGLPHPRGIDAMAEITCATQVAYDLTYDEAHVRAQTILGGAHQISQGHGLCAF